MMNLTAELTISRIVADDYRAAAIFQRHGLDFCCGGGRSVRDACRAKFVDVDALLGELAALATAAPDGLPNFNEYELDALADHIVERHHGYVREALPIALGHIVKVARVHGDRHPETRKIAALFERVAADLTSHMVKEERMLFPLIRLLADAGRSGEPASPALPGALPAMIGAMESEHELAGGGMEEIRRLSGGYVPPEDACMTYRVCYDELRRFEEDLHLHVHLENNILFRKGLALDGALCTSSPDGEVGS
jgi:regulator of cell morphogenesis and NO signaling